MELFKVSFSSEERFLQFKRSFASSFVNLFETAPISRRKVLKCFNKKISNAHNFFLDSICSNFCSKKWYISSHVSVKISTELSNDLIKVHSGITDKFFRFSADSGVAGIVVEALGVGNVPPAAFEGIKYAVEKGIPVVLVSRCPTGETLDIYSYPGAGKWLKELGVIFTDYLNGQKARIKLMLALGKTRDLNELHKIFEW